MVAERPTLDEIRTWPAAVNLPKAASALGISASHLRNLVKSGNSPVSPVPVPGRHVFATAALVRLLEGA
ncbi:DNA-binding protein [Streptomyces sp. NPDC007148]|uniref:DNA-binding protein n=1 Tax=Streptomyces sp. NPDC007148 TaxID=3364775 RepID=UPI0036B22059